MSEEMLHTTQKQASKIGPGLQEVAARTREAIAHAVEEAPHHASRWYDQARVQARHLQERGSEQYQVLRGHVERNAMTSTLVAFAAGFVVARFLFRR